MKFEIYDRVKIVKSFDSDLDGSTGTVIGGIDPSGIIILFDGPAPPGNYNPAIAITEHCLEKA